MSKSLLRGIAILESLKGQSIHGLSNSEIAQAIGESPVNTSRTLAALVEAGWVSRLETGRYTLGLRALQTAQAHAEATAQSMARMQETTQRIAAGAMY